MKMTLELLFNCPDDIRPHLERVFAGEYNVREFIIPGPRVIDLGANCGSFSLWAIHKWPGAKVSAYEPHPKTFEYLTQNAKPYGEMITCHNYGIGTPGMRVLGEGKNNCGESSFHRIQDNPHPNGVHCEVRSPLDLPEADIIKLDIEGCELEVLEPLINGGRKFLLIMLEYHNNYLRREIDKLLEKDYELIGSEVQHLGGRGIVKYAHRSIIPEFE